MRMQFVAVSERLGFWSACHKFESGGSWSGIAKEK
jgi:hypothetical protein